MLCKCNSKRVIVASRVHFRLAQFADRQHHALSHYLESEEHARHKELLNMKHRSIEEMNRTISNWRATGAPSSLVDVTFACKFANPSPHSEVR